MAEITYADVEDVIATQLRRDDLSAEDLFWLALARRANRMSDASLGGLLSQVAGRRARTARFVP